MQSPYPAPTFTEARLQQIGRLVRLQLDHPAEFNAWGRTSVRHAIFTMMLDCTAGGVPHAELHAALAGDVAPRIDQAPEQQAA